MQREAFLSDVAMQLWHSFARGRNRRQDKTNQKTINLAGKRGVRGSYFEGNYNRLIVDNVASRRDTAEFGECPDRISANGAQLDEA